MKEDWNSVPPDQIAALEETMEAYGHGKPPDETADNIDPEWFDGKRIDEIRFSAYFLAHHPMKCVSSVLYDIGGVVDTERLKKEIYDMIAPYIQTNIAKAVDRMLDAIRIAAFCDHMPVQEDRIHVGNGTLYLDGTFIPKMQLCRNRLPVNYNPDAPPPGRWLEFLNELLMPEDIPTLQEYMGYTLIPTNRAQKMLFVIGNGGEGKSRIGRVLRAILGDNMNTSSIQKLSTNQFARADLEGKLLMLDDDMKMEALSETNILKSVVTMEDKIDLERKGKQSTQGQLYARIIGFGNGSLSALYDRSDGFYRRQLILIVKSKDLNRVDDTSLGEKLIAEAEGIFLWIFEGTQRIVSNEFIFTISERSRKNMEEARKEDTNIIDFLESAGYIMFEQNTYATTKQIYIAYNKWCEDNCEKPFTERTFSGYMKKTAEKWGIVYDKNISIGSNKTARGYHGIHVQINTDDYYRTNMS